MIRPQLNGWQFWSLRFPSVVALTCAKTKLEVVLLASRSRLMQFQAGMVEVKIHGSLLNGIFAEGIDGGET